MIKPDGVQRGKIGQIIQRFEDKGLQLLGLRMKQPEDRILNEHYAELASKPFFKSLLEYIKSGPVVCMCWRGVNAVAVARQLIGATNPLKAEVGTIRGDFGVIPGRNLIHGADSLDSAERELELWFDTETEVLDWNFHIAKWIVDTVWNPLERMQLQTTVS